MPFLRKYGTGTGADIIIPVIKRGVVDYALSADWTPAAGDVKINIDNAGAANIGTLPVAVAMGNTAGWKFVFADAELQGKRIEVSVSDSATKAVEDQWLIIETYGNASAKYQADFSAANLPAALQAILGTSLSETTGGNLAGAFKKFFDVASGSLAFTMACVNQTGDAYAYLGTNLGALGANATAIATSVWASGTRTLTSFGTLATDTATAVWNAASRTLSAFSFSVTVGTNNDKTGYALTSAYDAAKTAASSTAVAAIATILSGITSLAQWLGLLAGKQTGDTTALAEIKATGAGSGTYDPTTDSQEALRDRGDAAYLTATGFATPTDVTNATSPLATEANATTNRNTVTAAITSATNTLATDITNATSPLATHIDATTIEGAITALGSPMQATAHPTVGGYASGQDPATLVLDATASAHNTAGTIGAKINASGGGGSGGDAGLDDPTDTTTYPNNTLVGYVRQMKAKTDLISGAAVGVSNPVLANGLITITANHSYLAADGNALSITFGAKVLADLTGWTLTLSAQTLRMDKTTGLPAGQITAAGAVTVATGTGQAVAFDITKAANTGPAEDWGWTAYATKASEPSSSVEIGRGRMIVARDYE